MIDSYTRLSETFRAASEIRAARIRRHLLPEFTGPEGEPLYIDEVLSGRPDADRGLIIVSGIHGIEGEFGSHVQTRHIEAIDPTDSMAILYIHLANPWGVAWSRRVNESNVDLNRNFISFDISPPDNRAYDENYQFIEIPVECGDWKSGLKTIEDWIARDGYAFVQRAITRGQYRRPTGLFYGGKAPSWSRRIIEQAVRNFTLGKERVALVDIHTGLGEWATCQIIVESYSDERMLVNMPPHVKAGSQDSVSAGLSGTLASAFTELSEASASVGMVAEFGTISPIEVFQALQGDHWRTAKDIIDGSVSAEITEHMKKAFIPNDAGWKDRCTSVCLNMLDTIKSAVQLTQ